MANTTPQASADIQLLETKLYIPQWRPGFVTRPRLQSKLRPWRTRKLTLISAPAGFGKTTLLAEWIAAMPSTERTVAWVSLDQRDNDPVLFWTYVITAVQRIQPGVGDRTLALLHAPQLPPFESLLTTLINEMSAIEQDFTLILDDYHVITDTSIHKALTFLLDYLPPHMHLVLATRADPPLPLARLRGYRQLLELRVADLRFTATEVATFLNDTTGLTLSASEVSALEMRTEGWIAGLQLAALSMHGRDDIAGFVSAFSGDDRYIVDYLLEEVLQRQPEPVRRFLLQTATLDRLSASLCDAVTQQDNSQQMLEMLERHNLFVIPLDSKRLWYRYHHLFADVLQAHAVQEASTQVALLHQRASRWYEQNNLPSEAICHALVAPDFGRAAELIERAWPDMRRRRQEATVRSWIKALPADLFPPRPVLSLVAAWVLLDDNQPDAAEHHLQTAERWLTETPHSLNDNEDEMLVADEAQFHSLSASIANARAYRAQALGDVPGTVAHAQQALTLMPAEDHYERGTTSALLGLAHWTSGNLIEAYRSFAEGLNYLQKGGGVLIKIGGTVILGHMRLAQGRLHEAIREYEEMLAVANDLASGTTVLPGTAELYLGLSEIHFEQGDSKAAHDYLQRGEALRDHASLPGYEYLWCMAQARILKAAKGDWPGALALLDEAERFFYTSPIPNVYPIPALRARLWVKQGQLNKAEAWARKRGLAADDAVSYLHEYEYVTLAQLLIAQYQQDTTAVLLEHAHQLLARLRQRAEAEKRMGSIIDIALHQALAHWLERDVTSALTALARTLALAEPQGYVRLFVEKGKPLADLLAVALQNEEFASSYVRHLYTEVMETINDAAPKPAESTLPDPLTDRELDVLRLLETVLTGPEIATKLTVSVNTVRTHTKNIYSKLGVSSRRAAVRRARELDLLK